MVFLEKRVGEGLKKGIAVSRREDKERKCELQEELHQGPRLVKELRYLEK